MPDLRQPPFLLDGATGTNLMLAGMPQGVCVEKWILENPAPIQQLQKEYAGAGCNAVMAPTFGANRQGLSRYGLGSSVADYNKRLVALSREAVGDSVMVAGDMSPTGIFVEPFGNATFDSLVDIFREQAFALKDAGVDYIALETFMSLTEVRAALIAAVETGLPVTASLTVENNLKTMSGGSVLSNLVTLAAMGAQAVGLNCSTGPEVVLKALDGVAEHVGVPLIAKPNAGLPGSEESRRYTPEVFASYVPKFFTAGAGILGGCCGTTPAHMAALREAIDRFSFRPVTGKETGGDGVRDFIAADEKQAYFISEEKLDFSHKIDCGPDLADDLLELEGGNAAARIRIQSEEDAHEFGMNAYLAKVPIVLLAYDLKALDTALKLYQGRAIIDSKSDPGNGMETIAKKYGAVII